MMMQTRIRVAAARALLAVAALGCAGCAEYYYPEQTAQIEREPADLMALNHQAVDALFHQVQPEMDKPVLVAAVVQIDDLDKEPAPLGRMITEQTAARLAQRGLRVVEVRLREGEIMALSNDARDQITSEAKQNEAIQAAQALLVGTYTVAAQSVFVSLKLVTPQGNTVLAAQDYALPLDNNVRRLLKKKKRWLLF